MNLTRMALVFVLITMPMMVISYTEVLGIQAMEQMEQQYTQIIHNAIDDSATALKYSMASVRHHGIQLEVDEVVETFLSSYHYGFNVIGATDKIRVDQHILALVIIDYDGFYIYGTREVRDPSGTMVLMPLLSEKHYYTYEDSDYLMNVTLDDYVTILDRRDLSEEKGLIGQVTNLPEGISALDFTERKARIIRDAVTQGLNYTVARHNRYTKHLGLSYEFYIPLGNDNALSADIESLGVMAFIQGHPLGGGHTMDLMAFGHSDVREEEAVIGYEDPAGDHYYCLRSCAHPNTDTQVKVFGRSQDAAMEGFYPCHMLGK